MHPARTWLLLASGCVGLCMSSGCITISPGAAPLSLKSLARPQVQHASHEEKVEEAPKDPKNPARLKLAYARLMEDSGELTEARRQYAAVTELQPKNVDALLGLARLDQMSGNVEAAEQGFKAAVKLAPDSATTQYSLGQFYGSQKRWSEASDALTKAMLADPNEPQYRYALAVSLARQGDIDSALPHFIRTIGDAEAHYNVGLILQEQGKLDEAERQFAIAVAKKPDLAEAQSWLTHLRQQRGARPPVAVEAVDADPTWVLPAGHSTSGTAAAAPRNDGSGAILPPPRQLSVQQLEQLRNQQPVAGL